MNIETQQLRDIAGKLLSGKKVDLVIGFEKGSTPGRSRPVILKSAADAARLVWDDTCSNNLTVYLPELFRKKPAPKGQPPAPPPRIAVVVKGCDALSVALLVRENQAIRQNLVLIGVPCKGIRDPKTGGIMACCEECASPVAGIADIKIAGESRKPSANRHGRVRELENMPLDQRWRRFEEEMAKCIRCYACRQACPSCYCRECFADQTQPKWIGVGNDPSDTMMYQLGRMFHMAGRCVGCDACVRACPMGVDLRVFTRKLAKDAEEIFGHDVAKGPECEALLSTFSEKDKDGFVTDPHKKKGSH